MGEKTVVYLKLDGEPPIPVTVQICWLPNGKIRPLMYWTPDNSCYKVKHVYESTKLAYLKQGGEGIRYRVNAELAESPGQDYHAYAHHEVYLYFASNLYCPKCLIDEGYGHASKKYIPVTLDVFPWGDYEIVGFQVDDKQYTVERTIMRESRGSYNVGGVGVWHMVEAREADGSFRLAGLYLEFDKWFVNKKETNAPLTPKSQYPAPAGYWLLC